MYKSFLGFLIMDRVSKSEGKFYIFKFDEKYLNDINNGKTLFSHKKRGVFQKIEANDNILLLSKYDNKLSFLAYTQVSEVFEDNAEENFNPRKLKLKGIKYFTRPIILKDIADKLDFVSNPDKPSSSIQEYKEISIKDFKCIYSQSPHINNLPYYLNRINFNLKEFILDSMKSLYGFLKQYNGGRNQIEIKTFIKLLKNLLSNYNINLPYSELKDFYARNVWQLNFKHNPSRDPNKFVYLYDSNGDKHNFSYISFIS